MPGGSKIDAVASRAAPSLRADALRLGRQEVSAGGRRSCASVCAEGRREPSLRRTDHRSWSPPRGAAPRRDWPRRAWDVDGGAALAVVLVAFLGRPNRRPNHRIGHDRRRTRRSRFRLFDRGRGDGARPRSSSSCGARGAHVLLSLRNRVRRSRTASLLHHAASSGTVRHLNSSTPSSVEAPPSPSSSSARRAGSASSAVPFIDVHLASAGRNQ